VDGILGEARAVTIGDINGLLTAIGLVLTGTASAATVAISWSTRMKTKENGAKMDKVVRQTDGVLQVIAAANIQAGRQQMSDEMVAAVTAAARPPGDARMEMPP
jgi:hypothetical protein